MKQSTVVQQTLVAATNVLTAIQSGSPPDINSLDLWTESLTRYVLFHPDQHPAAIELEDLSRQLRLETYDPLETIQQYILVFNQATAHLHHQSENIEYRPPLDDSYYPPPAG